jgi:hypothetical protein
MKIQGPATRPVAPEVSHPASAAAPAPTAAAPAAAGWTAKKAGATAPAAAPVDAEARTRQAAEKFFKAFEAHDTAGLKAAYRPDAKFKDNMFDLSKADSILKMWKGAPPFSAFKAEILSVKGNEVHTKWTADYVMFGNKVHNEIDSVITFDNEGKIKEQNESWDQKKWMKQALPMIPSWAQGVAYAVMRPLLSASMGG